MLTTVALPDRWWLHMVAKFNSQNMLIIFLSCFVSVWLQSLWKVLMWSKIFLFLEWVSKNPGFLSDFESIEKVAKSCVFNDTCIKFLPKNLFAYIIYFLLTLMVNTDETAEKNLFYNCVLEFHFTSISGLEGSILSKSLYSLLTKT